MLVKQIEQERLLPFLGPIPKVEGFEVAEVSSPRVDEKGLGAGQGLRELRFPATRNRLPPAAAAAQYEGKPITGVNLRDMLRKVANPPG